MNPTGRDDRLAGHIAVLMRAGTITASVLLAVGGLCTYLVTGPAGTVLLTAGCGVLIGLPVIRLAMMTGHFSRLGDRTFTIITLTVLMLVIAGGVAGFVR